MTWYTGPATHLSTTQFAGCAKQQHFGIGLIAIRQIFRDECLLLLRQFLPIAINPMRDLAEARALFDLLLGNALRISIRV